jgi:hypothetical protein
MRRGTFQYRLNSRARNWPMNSGVGARPRRGVDGLRQAPVGQRLAQAFDGVVAVGVGRRPVAGRDPAEVAVRQVLQHGRAAAQAWATANRVQQIQREGGRMTVMVSG